MINKFKNLIADDTELLDTTELMLDEELDESFQMDDYDDSDYSSRNVVRVYKPVSKTSTEKIMRSIKKGELCIVNFKDVSEDEASQILNQLSGAIYALDGKLQQISGQIIICAPKTYLLDQVDEDKL